MRRKNGRRNGKVKRIVKRAINKTMWETIREATGEDVVPVVEYLDGRKDISEFEIARKINAEVNRVRSALYRLQTRNLVTYFRKKDRIKGWYISYWTFNPSGVKYLKTALQRNKLRELKERLNKEEKHKGLFYICPSLCTRMEFDMAAEAEFKCPECGKILKHQDNTKTIEGLKVKIRAIEQ